MHNEPRFVATLEAVLEVSCRCRGPGPAWNSKETSRAQGDDFETLYNLTRLAYQNQIDEPEQMKLWQDTSP